MNDLVSVIVPIYNAEKYLCKCIESLLSQTYTNLEIILINDGSTDGTDKICCSYANNDSRIIYINKENSGQSDTRNYGIDLSKGKYLFFMDSDDYIDSGYIEYSLNQMNTNIADLSICNYYHVYSGSEVREEREFSAGIYDLSSSEDKYNFIVNVFLPYKCGFEVWNRLYNAEIIRKNNIRFPIFKPVVAEDACFNLYYIMYSNKIAVSNERFYYYVHNEGSTMDQNKGIQLDRYNEVSKKVYDHVEKSMGLDYIKDYYVYIHVLLIYHEIMNCGLGESKEYICRINNREYFRKIMRFGVKSFFVSLKSMGMMRGIKYTLLGIIYKMWIS